MELRAVRGGSWNNHQNNARAAARNRNNPDNNWNNIGVRVLASHDFSSAGSARCPSLRGRPAAEAKTGAACVPSRQLFGGANIEWPGPLR